MVSFFIALPRRWVALNAVLVFKVCGCGGGRDYKELAGWGDEVGVREGEREREMCM